MKPRFLRKILRPKIFPWYAMAAVLLWYARPTPGRVAVGLAFVVVGEALRIWGAGHLVKNDRLTISGPYAFLRHPLYAGTLLVGTGLLWMGGGAASPWLLAIGLGFFFVHYFPYKERIESARLERLYGAPYARYRAAVPALLPSLAAFHDPGVPGGAPWSAAKLRDNHEDGAAIAVALAVLALALRPLLPA